jgi:hypothetical protein
MSKIVAIANHKGGCGKTTLASHLAWWAEENKIRTFGMTLDPQGNLIQRVINDPRLQPERTYRFGNFVELMYSPNAVPSVLPRADLIIVDFPPGFDICGLVQPHLWLIPVDGREAVEGLLTAMRTTKLASGGVGIYAVLNMIDGAGRGPLDAARDALKKVPGLQFWPQEIPDTGTIQRTAEFREPTWRVPNGKGTAGDTAMRKFCADVFAKLGL